MAKVKATDYTCATIPHPYLHLPRCGRDLHVTRPKAQNNVGKGSSLSGLLYESCRYECRAP